MSVVAPTVRHDPHLESPLATPPPSSSSSFPDPPPFHQSISSPVIVPFPIYHPSPHHRSSMHAMTHTQSFSALGPQTSPIKTYPTVPPPAPRPTMQSLPSVSPDASDLKLPPELPPTPDPSPPNSKILFPDSAVQEYNRSGQSVDTPRRIPSVPMEATSSASAAARMRANTGALIPIRPPNEHRPKSMGPPRQVKRSQTAIVPTSQRMIETRSADSRHRITQSIHSPYSDSPGFSRTYTAPADSLLKPTSEVSESELSGPDGLEAKIVLLGSQGVGKTSLILRCTKGTFDAAPTTIGSSLHTRKLVQSGVRVKLQIWDTAGQERFRSMAPIYYRGAHVCILVYDISDRRSFDDVRSWLEELRKTVPKETVIYIVGSKIDLADKRAVTSDEARRMVRLWMKPPQPESSLTPPTNRGLFRSSSLAARSETPPTSALSTPTRSHSHSALVTLAPPSASGSSTRPQSSLEISEIVKPASKSVPFPTRPPALQIISPDRSSTTLPLSPRSTKISFHGLQSPSRPTSMIFTEPIRPSLTPASPSGHAVSAGRFSISGVLGYSRTNSISGAISNLAKLAEDNPRPARRLSEVGALEGNTGTNTPVAPRVGLESTPVTSFPAFDTRRKSEDWSARSSKPWRMGEGPGAAEALGEFGAGVRRRQSGGNLLESDSRPTSPLVGAHSTNGLTRQVGRARGGSVGMESRLYVSEAEAVEEEWGTEVEGMRLGEVSALSGKGVELLVRSISALLVDKREKIEHARTLRRKGSVMLVDPTAAATDTSKSKSRQCCF